MKSKYILALDQGTTSSRSLLFDHDTNVICSRNKEFPQIYPQPGWVEHNANDIFDSQLFTMKELLKENNIDPEEIAAIGITNQRETIVLWDKKTGEPVHNAIVWQCRRTASICEKLEQQQLNEIIREKTGLLLDAYFSGTKIKWIFDRFPEIKQRAINGEILAGTVDTWLIWKLTGGKCHVTDYTNASRTMLFNIYMLDWDKDLLELFDIPACILPKVCNSSEVYGYTDKDVCGFSIPIASAIGDQQAALFGQGCFSQGDAKTTYGTGCFLLMNTGTKPVVSKNKLLTTIALGRNNEIQYALEGSIFMGGAIIQWLRDELELISSSHECDVLAESVPNSNGAYIVPAFTGLGSPYWDMYARGTIVGLTRGVKKAHICRAALESIAFQVKDIINCMVDDSNTPLTSLKVDGGASVSDLMLQFQSDILDSAVFRPKNIETTGTGAAFLAGLAVGFWKDTDELFNKWQIDKMFTPSMLPLQRTTAYQTWNRAVEKSRNWILKESVIYQ